MKKFTLSFIFLLLFSATATAYDVSYIQCFGEVVLLAGNGTPAEVAIFDAKTMKVIDIVTFRPEKNALVAISKKPNYPTEITIGPVPVIITPTPTPMPTPTSIPYDKDAFRVKRVEYLSLSDPASKWLAASTSAQKDLCERIIQQSNVNLSTEYLYEFLDSLIVGNDPSILRNNSIGELYIAGGKLSGMLIQ